MAGEVFDLGRVLQTAEAIKGMRRESVMDGLRQTYMGTQQANLEQAGQLAQAQEQRAVTTAQQQKMQFNQEQQVANTKLLNAASAEIMQNPAAVERWLPQLQQAGVLPPGDPNAWRSIPPEQIQAKAKEYFESTSAALEALMGSQGGGRVQSAQILANGNIGYLTTDGKLVDTGQQAKEQLQLTEMAGGRGIVNLRDRSFETLSPADQERQAAAQQASAVAGAQASAQQGAQIKAIPERAAAEQAAERVAAQAKGERTFRTYATAMAGVEKALAATQTDPVTGRVPALTAAQQTADGAIAAISPVLKELFRSAGEGVFTDRDQQLLTDMIPTRKDHPEARAAKISMINQIVASKLGASPDGPAGAVQPDAAPRKRVKVDSNGDVIQ